MRVQVFTPLLGRSISLSIIPLLKFTAASVGSVYGSRASCPSSAGYLWFLSWPKTYHDVLALSSPCQCHIFALSNLSHEDGCKVCRRTAESMGLIRWCPFDRWPRTVHSSPLCQRRFLFCIGVVDDPECIN